MHDLLKATELAAISTERVATLIDDVEGLSTLEAADQLTRASAVKRLVTMNNETRRLRRDLGRLEIHLIRRLATLDAFSEIQRNLHPLGRLIKQWDRSKLETLLCNYAEVKAGDITPTGFYQWLVGPTTAPTINHVGSPDDELVRVLGGGREMDVWVRRRRQEMIDEVGEYIDLLSKTGNAVTVQSVTNGYIRRKDLQAIPETYLAVAEIVRQYVMRANGDEQLFGEAELPRFVTYRNGGSDEDAQWLHIPIDQATVEQFAWMVEYRKEQAKQLTLKADALTGMLEALRNAARRSGLDNSARIGHISEGASA